MLYVNEFMSYDYFKYVRLIIIHDSEERFLVEQSYNSEQFGSECYKLLELEIF